MMLYDSGLVGKMHQCSFHFKIINSLYARTRHKNNVITAAEFFFVQTADFPDQSHSAMTYDTVADFFTY